MSLKNGRFTLPIIVTIVLAIGAAIAFFINRGGFMPGENDGRTTEVVPIIDTQQNEGAAIEGVTTSVTTPGKRGTASLLLAVSEGQEGAQQPVEPVPLANGEPLSEEDAQQIVDRLPELTAVSTDILDFNLPDAPIPAPRPGDTIDQPFPPEPPQVAPETVETTELEVLRYSPEGELPIAPFVNVTFNQPMVPLTSLDVVNAADVPVAISPDLPGTWKWISPQVLRFEYDGGEMERFPKSTDYQVTIPAGTESALGGKLASAVSWTFSTPPLKLTSSYPNGGSRPLDPLFYVAFDQKIDVDAVFSKIQVTADGQPVIVQLATEEEITANKQVEQFVKNGRSDRQFVFRAQQDLPQDAQIIVVFPVGTPSAEGPRVTTEGQSFSFFTYPPLTIVEHVCGWYYDEDCPPLTPFRISFSNPLDVDAYTEDMLQITPALPDAYVDISGNTLSIYGSSQGRTTYRVRVSGDIQDVYGQTLGNDETLRFSVGSAPQALSGLDRRLVTLDPAADPALFTIYSINYDRLNLRIYEVDPEEDWLDYLEYRRKYNSNEPLPPPGNRVVNRTLRIDNENDVLTETSIDLSGELNNGVGHLLVVVEPPSSFFEDERDARRRAVQAWVQVTQIGLDVFNDHSTMIVWTTNLQDGAPLSGVDITTESGFTQLTTDGSGMAEFTLPREPHEMNLIIAKMGNDTAILQSNDTRNNVLDSVRWFVFDDRQMYRPGEEVHVKGWLRLQGNKQGGDIGLVGNGVTAVSYRVIGSQGNELHTGTAEVSRTRWL